jgi:hypothetical protein
VNAVMNLRVSENRRNLSSGYRTDCISSCAKLNSVSYVGVNLGLQEGHRLLLLESSAERNVHSWKERGRLKRRIEMIA